MTPASNTSPELYQLTSLLYFFSSANRHSSLLFRTVKLLVVCSTMAQKFLEGLPKVNTEDLPKGSGCMICQEAYSTRIEEDGTMESAVRLPCGHDIGVDCIRTWLSLEKEAKNSCPACRMRFFPAQPRPYMEHRAFVDLEGDEEDNWHGPRGRVDLPRRANPGAFYLEVLRTVGEAGQPPREGQEMERREAGEEDEQDRIRSWWPEFFQTATEVYEESIRRARAVVTTPRVPPSRANMSHWSPYPYLQVSVSEPRSPEETDPQHLYNVVQALATAFRTLPFREALVHSILRDQGAEARLPTPIEGDLRPLSAEQEEALFREMERRGAFLERDSARQYEGLTNRERWQLHREEDGEAWNPHTRLWSSDWRV